MKIPHPRVTEWLVKLNHMTQAEDDACDKLADVPVGLESALTKRLVANLRYDKENSNRSNYQ